MTAPKRTIKCRLCSVDVPVGGGLEAMEDHWKQRHSGRLAKLRERSAEATQGKMPNIEIPDPEDE